MDAKRDAVSAAPTSLPACSDCGVAMHDRQYRREQDSHTCEHCFLERRKRQAGMSSHPYELFVESLAEALDLRERETGLHSKRVAAHTLMLARQFFEDANDLREIYWGSLLHDVGKIGVPDAVLLKPDRLTAQEWEIMRQHPRHGQAILSKLPYLAMAADVVLRHEERFDGSGYPDGLAGDEIPLPARLFAVIDTLDAMTFDRPYRKALPFDVARAEIIRMSGSQFDPLAVQAFLNDEAKLREMTVLAFPGATSAQQT